MRKTLFLLIALMLFVHEVTAQTPSSRSFIVGVGTTSCGSGSQRVQSFLYDPKTNLLSNASVCAPLLNPSFSASRAVIDYNPKDNKIYYFRRVLNGAVYDTHVWSWAPGTCPAGPLAYKSIDTFPSAYLTVAFDRDGIGWMVNLLNQPDGTYNISMTRIDFSTGSISAAEPIALPSGVKIYQAQGDYLITPSGTMFFGYNNKLFTINYENFGSGLNATYIDTIPLPSANQNMIGLAYAGGDFLGSFFRSGACGYSEIDMLTGDRFPVTYAGTFSSYDNTSVTSSIGTAKELVSVTPTGTPGQYDVVYDVNVQNLGNYPISSVQVIDSLQFINGLGNVVSATASMQSNPGGLILNAGYNGITDAQLLMSGQTLPNFPVANNFVIIRVSVRLNNIINGQIYNNTAVATGLGFSSLPIRDSSTNGQNADLNLNEIADDAGENQPTPFVITIAGEYPPCPLITTSLHYQDFGSGTGLSTTISGGSSTYTGASGSPLSAEQFALTNNPSNGNAAYWNSMTDHTGNAQGRMMVVDADVLHNVIYSTTVNNLCSNLKYSFVVWAANISNAAQVTFCNAIGGFKQPKLIFRVRDASTGLVLTNLSSGDITNSNWQEYGMRFILPTGYSSVILEVINDGEGGCGNDVAIDDIRFGLCDPTPTINAAAPSAGCEGGSTTMSAALSDPTIISGTIDYQWQSSTDNLTWTDISGATASSYTIASMTPADAIYYRVIVASAGNINSANCRYASNGFQLTLQSQSLAPTGITASAVTTCANDPVTLTVTGGSLGSGASWVWYNGSCGGTPIGSGTSISVSPADTTTYFVRAEGNCNNTTCQTVTINAGTCVVLPVSVLDLTGRANSLSNQLDFTIINDESLKQVEILRSLDGRNFVRIDVLQPGAKSGNKINMTYLDVDIVESAEVYHYKVRIITSEDKVMESKVVTVRRRNASGLSAIRVSPNPASGAVKLNFQSEIRTETTMKVMDQSGRVVKEWKVNVISGDNTLVTNEVRNLPDGMYILMFQAGSQTFREKLIIKH